MSSKEISSVTASSLPDYLEKVKVAKYKLLEVNKDDYVVYRGQPLDADLLPKLGRNCFEKPDKLSFEEKTIKEFRHLSYPLLNQKDYSDWEILAIAQHHGLPTRLLDWTANPLIALWFAISEFMAQDTLRVVWCYSFNKSEIVDVDTDPPLHQTKTLVYQPKRIASRIVSQDGWFTSHFYRADNNKYTALNRKIGSGPKLVKFIVNIRDEVERKDMLNDLDAYGINALSVFYDLEGLCKYLHWKNYLR